MSKIIFHYKNYHFLQFFASGMNLVMFNLSNRGPNFCQKIKQRLSRGGGRCKILGVLMTFPYGTFLQFRNIGGAKCSYFACFEKYWGCYSTPSTPSFATPVRSICPSVSRCHSQDVASSSQHLLNEEYSLNSLYFRQSQIWKNYAKFEQN